MNSRAMFLTSFTMWFRQYKIHSPRAYSKCVSWPVVQTYPVRRPDTSQRGEHSTICHHHNRSLLVPCCPTNLTLHKAESRPSSPVDHGTRQVYMEWIAPSEELWTPDPCSKITGNSKLLAAISRGRWACRICAKSSHTAAFTQHTVLWSSLCTLGY